MTRTATLLALVLAPLLAAPAGAQRAPATAGPPAAPPADDVVPAAIDAALAAPEDPFVFGIPHLADGEAIVKLTDTGSARCVADVGDVTGDGASDFAVGFAATTPLGSLPGSLQLRDGQSGAVLSSATPDHGAFRTLRGLAVDAGRLALGVTSPRGRVEVRNAATGASIWARNLSAVAASPAANVLAVEWTADVDGDGAHDLLVAGGRQLNGVWLLSGLDGATLWQHATAGPAADVRSIADLDADGVPDVIVAGGLATPFATALSGAHGNALWQSPLAGPGSVVLPLPDVDRDGRADLAVGLFAEPGTCLIALDGAHGAALWVANYAPRNATSLARLADIDGDGLDDFAFGSLDNAVSGVLSASGLNGWRSEGSTVNGGSMLPVAEVGDVNGNGSDDVLTASLDHQVYVLDGAHGFFLAGHDLRCRGVAVAALADGDGDGRRELLAAGSGALHELRGSAGTAGGPVLVLTPPGFLGGITHFDVFAYPTSLLILLGSLDTGFLKLPGYSGALGLDLAGAGFLHYGIAPGAGFSGYNIPGLPREFLGLTLHFQAVTNFSPGHGAFSQVVSHRWVF